jgi:mannosyltransferase
VHFLGEQPASDLPAWFQRLTIYAFTSRREGFGLTLVEAMASGAAVVAARAGAAEFVIEHGETGFLVPPGDVEELVSALEPLMRDPARAEEIGRRARMRVEAVHAVENEAAAIVDVYRRLWARSPC